MYVIVALLGVTGVLRKRIIFNIVTLLIVTWYVLASEHFPLLHELGHERMGLYFLLGALFYMNRDKVIFHWIGVVVLSILMLLNFKNSIYNLVYAFWFTYLVLYISFHRTIKLPDFGKHGDFSYGLYLYAFPMTQVNILLFGPDNPWFIVLTTFIATMVLAMCSWFLVEKPALQTKGMYTTWLLSKWRVDQS
jgi:peptidoglycan/LPS O-acetylase OafA/YrhL